MYIKKTFSLILCAGIHHLESLPKSEPSDWTGRFGSEKAFLGKYWPNRSSLPCARIWIDWSARHSRLIKEFSLPLVVTGLAMIGLLKKLLSICQSGWRGVRNAFPVISSAVADPGEGPRGPLPPLFLDRNEAWRGGWPSPPPCPLSGEEPETAVFFGF